MGPPRIRGSNPSARVYRPLAVRRKRCKAHRSAPGRGFPVMRTAQLLRGSPRRKAVAGFAAAITVVTSFFVVQGLAGADVVTAPPTKLLAVGPTSPDNGFPVWYKDSTTSASGSASTSNDPQCNLGTERAGPHASRSRSRTTSRTRRSTSWPSRSWRCPTGPPRCSTTTSRPRSTPPSPAAGQQITFGRVRIRITTPTTGHYVITHPYGVDAFDVTDAGDPEHQLHRGHRHRRPGRLQGRARLPDQPVPALGHRPDQGPGRRLVPR